MISQHMTIDEYQKKVSDILTNRFNIPSHKVKNLLEDEDGEELLQEDYDIGMTPEQCAILFYEDYEKY